VILFDGVCNLCNRAVQFVVRHDRHRRFLFASLQSRAAARLLRGRPGVEVMEAMEARPESVVLVHGDRIYTRSTAALRIAGGLGFPWSLGSVLVAVPRPLRDWVYDVVARNRYRWFGKRDVCMVPTPELQARFLPD
jgi:predicted DCC family thiol-disulfide oxidoreductase YuxK